MKLDIKDLGKLEREIVESSNGNSAVIVLDTGGLIDIVHATRNYSLNGNGKKEKNPNYEKATSFLKYISEKVPVIITPKTYQEIQDHGRMKLNSHITELSPKVVDFSLKVMTDSARFIEETIPELSMDDIRYDAYWASKEGCIGNPKKDAEGCSDADKEILSIAAYLSKCKVVESVPKKINKVLVISSDAHIIQGTEFLKRGFDGKYSGIVPISTRH